MISSRWLLRALTATLVAFLGFQTSTARPGTSPKRFFKPVPKCSTRTCVRLRRLCSPTLRLRERAWLRCASMDTTSKQLQSRACETPFHLRGLEGRQEGVRLYGGPGVSGGLCQRWRAAQGVAAARQAANLYQAGRRHSSLSRRPPQPDFRRPCNSADLSRPFQKACWRHVQPPFAHAELGKKVGVLMGILVIAPEKCSNCRSCELVCSLVHEGEFNPARSRVRVTTWERDAAPFP